MLYQTSPPLLGPHIQVHEHGWCHHPNPPPMLCTMVRADPWSHSSQLLHERLPRRSSPHQRPLPLPHIHHHIHQCAHPIQGVPLLTCRLHDHQSSLAIPPFPSHHKIHVGLHRCVVLGYNVSITSLPHRRHRRPMPHHCIFLPIHPK